MRKLIYSLIVLALISCGKHFVKTKNEFAHYSLPGEKASKRFDDSIARYKNFVDAETNRVIATADRALTKEGAETTLGNFVCDALEFYAAKNGSQADIVILNRGGLRTDLPSGEIRVKNIFELMPFENEIVILKVKGKDLLAFANLLPAKKHPFKGINVVVKEGMATVSYNGKPVAIDDEFSVITSDYLANGGDGFSFFQQAQSRTSVGTLVRNAIIAYCEHLAGNGQNIKPYKDGRFEISE